MTAVGAGGPPAEKVARGSAGGVWGAAGSAGPAAAVWSRDPPSPESTAVVAASVARGPAGGGRAVPEGGCVAVVRL